jgi:hypothetical protein
MGMIDHAIGSGEVVRKKKSIIFTLTAWSASIGIISFVFFWLCLFAKAGQAGTLFLQVFYLSSFAAVPLVILSLIKAVTSRSTPPLVGSRVALWLGILFLAALTFTIFVVAKLTHGL